MKNGENQIFRNFSLFFSQNLIFRQFPTGATWMIFCAIPIVHGAKDIYFTWKNRWGNFGQHWVNRSTYIPSQAVTLKSVVSRRLILTKFQVWFWKREIILDWYYTSSKEEIIICNKLSRTNFWLNVLQWFLINFKLFFCESVSAAGRPKQRIFSKLSTKFQKNDFFIKQIVSKHYLVCLGLTPTIFRPWINSLLLYSSPNIACPQNEKE